MRAGQLFCMGIGAGVVLALSACAQIVGFPDVTPGDGGATDAKANAARDATADARGDAKADGTDASTDGLSDATVSDAFPSDAGDAGDAADAVVGDGGWGPVTTLASGLKQPSGLAVVHGTVYWVNGIDDAIDTVTPDASVDVGGTVAFALATPASDLVTDGTYLLAQAIVNPDGGRSSGFVAHPGVTSPDAAISEFVSAAIISPSAIAAGANEFYIAGPSDCGVSIYDSVSGNEGGWTSIICVPSDPDTPSALSAGSQGNFFLGTEGGPLRALGHSGRGRTGRFARRDRPGFRCR